MSERPKGEKTIGVIGAGQMGAGIAHVCALAGYDVVLDDINKDALAKALGLIDRIVSEPVGGAHRDHEQMMAFLKRALADAHRQVADLKAKELLERRYERLQSYGRFSDTKATA